MKNTHSTLLGAFGAAACFLLLPACETSGPPGALSIVPKESNLREAIRILEGYKIDSEVLAETAPESAQASYERAASLVDKWVEAKKAESALKAEQLTGGQIDLSANAVPDEIGAAVVNFKNQATGGRESAGTAILIYRGARAVAKLVREKRRESAEMLARQLDLLKWSDWETLRTGAE